jgi:3-hydroxybutyryl-CoA dehydrogenase
MTVAILGAGPLGRWLAVNAARAGFSVLLEDVMPTHLHHAQEYVRQQLQEALGAPSLRVFPAQGGDSCSEGGIDPPPANVQFVSTIEDAVRQADLVIDCVPDELESKLEILWLLDRMAPPHTVFNTPTTRLSIADLADCTYRPGQCVAIVAEAASLTGESPANLVLRTTPKTTPATIALVEGFWHQLGFSPMFELDSAVN